MSKVRTRPQEKYTSALIEGLQPLIAINEMKNKIDKDEDKWNGIDESTKDRSIFTANGPVISSSDIQRELIDLSSSLILSRILVFKGYSITV